MTVPEPIEEIELRRHLDAHAATLIERIDVLAEVDSTNRHIAAHPPSAPGRLVVCTAEFQTAGRGRRGRRWSAPPATGICMSLGWRFAATPRGLSALTLAAGVAARRALARACAIDIELKWPNDLVWQGRKLGGILVEHTVATGGACSVVVGLGLNVRVPAETLAQLSDWPGGAVDLTAAGAALPSKSRLAAVLIGELARVLAEFEERGFAAYRDEWRAADHLCGREVSLADARLGGPAMALGIAEDGALILRTREGGVRRIVAGDVSVRWQS